MISVVRFTRLGGKLDAWWQARGYERNPFVAPNMEDVGEHLERLEHWLVSPPWPKGYLRGALDVYGAIADPNTPGLAVVWGRPGTGKTFYCRLGEQMLPSEPHCRDVLAIGIADLVEVGLSGVSAPSACQIARCMLNRIRASGQVAASRTMEGQMLGGEDDLGSILLACHQLATSGPVKDGKNRIFVLLDGLDKVYYQARDKCAVIKAIAGFITTVSGGICGEHLAVRVFLPSEIWETLTTTGMLDPVLMSSIGDIPLSWTRETILQVIERRFASFCTGEDQQSDHLARFLSHDAIRELNADFDRREKNGSLCPRHAIKILAAIASEAATEKKTGPIPPDTVRNALKAALIPSWDLEGPIRFDKRRRDRVQRLWPLLMVMVLLFLVLRDQPTRDLLIHRVVDLPQAMTAAVNWIARSQDIIGAVALLVIVMSLVVFMVWCFAHSFLKGKRPDPRACLRHVWQYLKERWWKD